MVVCDKDWEIYSFIIARERRTTAGRKQRCYVAGRQHICCSINSLLCGTWVSVLAAEDQLQSCWSSGG